MKLLYETQFWDDIYDDIFKNNNKYEINDEELVDIVNDEFANEIDEIKYYIDGEDFWLIGGTAGTWQGQKDYYVQHIGDFDTFLSKLRVDDLKIVLYKKYGGYFMEITGVHHDGTNYYELATLDALTKDELSSIFRVKGRTRNEILHEINPDYYILN
jgi:hypothetical protein